MVKFPVTISLTYSVSLMSDEWLYQKKNDSHWTKKAAVRGFEKHIELFRSSEDSVSLNSPLKDLKKPIQTLSPTLSVKTILAIENSKRKRKRVQSMTGEVLTNENVLERLAAEESDSKNKFHQVNIKKDVKDTESFKVKQGSWVERLSTGQEVNYLNSLDK
ncbi:uncharacterized protein TNIN_51171 [Trichonephila inaurata madagascariensis]|uniref:Uncharacterized protein n=1 Tax=Trichonephila inaurata madagascariensis TaxID=2747483 RepID=A0A8X6Y813_9ARAC|nr:uncharacterized protein TNIN_51171 [Trichonephila inaurata madagascariensis]